MTAESSRVIVCAIEDRERSGRALEAAGWLARGLGASLVLAHAFDPMAVHVPPARELGVASLTSDDVARVEREHAQRQLAATAADLVDLEPTVELVEGRPVPELLALVARHGAQLLVAGTAARAGVDRVLIGSVSSELAAKAPCPVVTVPSEAALDEPGPVLAGYDGSDHSLRAARHAAALAARLGRDLVLMHTLDAGEQPVQAGADLASELHAAARWCADAGGEPSRLDVSIAVEEGDPVTQLAAAAERRHAPLVVSGTRGRNALSAALLGSVSVGLVRAAARPVVLVGPSVEPGADPPPRGV